MTEWQKEIGAITLFVEDLDRSKAFYQDVFSLPALNEDTDGVMFRFENTLVFLTKSAAAPRLIGPAHVGSPDIFYEGDAGPYHLLVAIRPPVVIPGIAEVEVRSTSNDVLLVLRP